MPGMFWPFNRMTLDGEDVGSIVRWIGHDAAIFGGNSDRSSTCRGRSRHQRDQPGPAGAIPPIWRAGRRRDYSRWPGEARMDRSQSAAPHIEQGDARCARRRDDRRIALRRAGFASGDILLSSPDTTCWCAAEEVPVFNQMVMRLPVGSR